jgi:hypothetical protein
VPATAEQPLCARRQQIFLRYRGHSLEIELVRDAVRVNAMRCSAASIRVGVRGRVHDLGASEARRFILE